MANEVVAGTQNHHRPGCPGSGFSDLGIAQSTTNLLPSITRRNFLTTFAAAALAPTALSVPLRHIPRFTVLSLFHPRCLILHAEATLTIQLDDQVITLPRGQSLAINATRLRLEIRDSILSKLQIVTPTTFSVEVPNKLRRIYRGTLTIDNDSKQLRCIVGIERELAVASIVAAESPPHATLNALAAQAIAARSFLLAAKTAHADADFCDTTHCQFLRDPPPVASAYTASAGSTAGLVVQFRGPEDDVTTTLAAMYSRSCGGRTRTLAELGLPGGGYPYYAVECAFCRAHPELWQRDLSVPMPNGERSRLAYNRIHGWSALPGRADSSTALRIEGRGVGHGLGLCQLGAAAMARQGASFAEILSHYYPNTTLAHAT